MNSFLTEEIAGVDEVGKGSLFGPVFAGAAIIKRNSSKILHNAGLKDSKKLSPKKRKMLIPVIKENCLIGIGQASAREIDNFGIRLATEKAMIRALEKLPYQPKLTLIDGILKVRGWPHKQETIIRGEDKYLAIAAASVYAKYTRDELITRLSKIYFKYGLERHFGYGTSLHRENLYKYGPSNIHRKSFLTKFNFIKSI